MNDTPTPRTDEISKHLDEAFNLDSAVDFVVYADKLQELSRQLERELAEVKASLAKVLSRLRGCGDCDPCIGGRPDQCAVGHLEVK